MVTLTKSLDERIYIKWNNRYCTGIPTIDEEHKELIGILNKTIDAKRHSDNKEELKEVLEEMTKFALEHFKTEEAYMKKFNYPDYKYHSEEHYNFFTKTIAYFDRVVNGDYHISNELIEYLKQWIVHHIQESDRQYIDCFKKNGLK
jgi:hemerythrin-like metal-binding protein